MMIIARTESEEKALLVGESGLFLNLGSGTSSDTPVRLESSMMVDGETFETRRG